MVVSAVMRYVLVTGDRTRSTKLHMESGNYRDDVHLVTSHQNDFSGFTLFSVKTVSTTIFNM